jgi:hypothetical protein
MPYPVDPSFAANRTHNANLFSAESVRQTALAGATTQAAATAADAAYAHSVLTSALSNGVQPGAALCALYELGLRG